MHNSHRARKTRSAAPRVADWEAIKRISHSGAGLIRLTRGAGCDSCTKSESSLVQGFARTARSETGNRPIIILDPDGTQPLGPEAAAICIANVFELLLQNTDSSEGTESEFIERGGILHVPRLVEDIDASEGLKALEVSQVSKTTPSLHRLAEVGSSRLFVDTPGLLDSLHFAADERTTNPLPDGHIEVDVKAAGINFKDVMMAMGQIQVEDLGCECSGVVSAVFALKM
jgi:hypothetical protein